MRPVRACSCVAMAKVWAMTNLSRRAAGRRRGRIPGGPNQGSKSNGNGAREGLVRADPRNWLITVVDGWGLDGALLRLSESLSSGALKATQSTCDTLSRGLQSAEINSALTVAKARFGESVEDRARADLGQWLALGCPVTEAGLGILRGQHP